MNNKTILTMVIVTIILTIGSVQMANAGATSNNTIKTIETTESGSLITYDDNTGYYIAFDEVDNNIIEFINSNETKLKEEINVMTESTDNFYLEDNTIAIKYDNNTYEILEVESIDETETGTLYNFTDGAGYYIEKGDIQ